MPSPGISDTVTTAPAPSVCIGTAGWTLPRATRDEFPREGSHLERYATVFRGVEINSSFYRQHRRATYERWAVSVPEDFRFAIKLPRAITHDQRLVAADVLLEVFLDEARGLGSKFGPLLVQLPPSLALDASIAMEFFATLRQLHGGDVVCEPRHESWFGPRGDALFAAYRVSRVGADPACVSAAAEPGGDPRVAYLRLHGSPRMYYSQYSPAFLRRTARRIEGWAAAGVTCWCMFDNTTLGFAMGNALGLERMLSGPTRESALSS
ncbi:MAG: hypothetical protein JWN53_1516 [Gemmatimonadetes bacterium]|nr:hypothetical protein [Gemmatimonadota bacterium]